MMGRLAMRYWDTGTTTTPFQDPFSPSGLKKTALVKQRRAREDLRRLLQK